jgi:hypothetical protein
MKNAGPFASVIGNEWGLLRLSEISNLESNFIDFWH